jgi:hypothetical protein
MLGKGGGVNFQLMCQDVPVADFAVNEITGQIISDLHIDNREYLPLSVLYDGCSGIALQKWLDNRSVSANRQDITEIVGLCFSLTRNQLLDRKRCVCYNSRVSIDLTMFMMNFGDYRWILWYVYLVPVGNWCKAGQRESLFWGLVL